MVVLLFAEARDLLPRDNPIYHGSYGLQGLREALERLGGGAAHERLRLRYGAWPRALALFRLIYEGSHHADLPIRKYGGGLFAPGNRESNDDVLRALAVFEDPRHAPSDFVVRSLIELLTKTRIRMRQGGGSKLVPVPVDFGDLSSEYIGILYEGLLDYELRQAPKDDPILFLALGDEPALPLARLEGMDDAALASLVEKMGAKAAAEHGGGEEGDEEDDEDPGEERAEEDIDAEEIAVEANPGEAVVGDEEAEAAQAASDEEWAQRQRAQVWARRAVVAGTGRRVRRTSEKARDLKDGGTSAPQAIFKLPNVRTQPDDAFRLLGGKPIDDFRKDATTTDRGQLARIADKDESLDRLPVDRPEKGRSDLNIEHRRFIDDDCGDVFLALASITFQREVVIEPALRSKKRMDCRTVFPDSLPDPVRRFACWRKQLERRCSVSLLNRLDQSADNRRLAGSGGP
jgi:hypothetical protein